MQKIRADMNIGENMRRLRKLYGFKQDELVAKIELLGLTISRSTYSRYETGELNVPVSVLVALHMIYGCKYDDFFMGLDIVT